MIKKRITIGIKVVDLSQLRNIELNTLKNYELDADTVNHLHHYSRIFL